MTAPLVQIEDVAKTWRGGARALDGVSLQIAEGEIFGLLGPNGAGKTTLLSILLGLARKDRGTVRVAGRDVDRERAALRAVCGLAPQDLAFYPTLTVLENLHFYAAAGGLDRSRRRARVDEAVARTQLAAHTRQRADRLSGGLQRRLNLAIALLGAPRLLCLDEPTAGVDPQSRAFLLDVVRELARGGTTVVYTSHYMDEVQQVCSQLAILDHGRVLAQGPLTALLAADRALHVTLSGAAPPALMHELRQRFGGAEVEGAEIALPVQDPLAAAAGLREVLARHGLGVAAIRHGHGDLEGLFLRLTQRRLRDG
ncbi:MAG TPA: ABC transporter ATP-binding protein [Candidatus Binatia bacterium]|nr:ABC transporter ATP-binding protein [Candidatus Binatia bacterium]